MSQNFEPLVSMVLVTNRRSRYLPESLSSMMRQTHQSLEIIVVDDGSPDPGALRDLLSPGVRYVRQSPSGVSIGRNRGVAEARGELIGFFDDDDRYPYDWVGQHVQRHIEEPAVVLTYAGIRVIEASGAVMMIDSQRQGDIHDIFRRNVGILAGSMVIKREAWLAGGGFNPQIRYAEDLDLVLRLAHIGPFCYVPGVVRDYRAHEGNVTRRHRELAQSIRAVNNFHRQLMYLAGRLDLVEDLRVSNEANNRFAAWRAVRESRKYLRRRNLSGAVTELAWAASFAPTAPLSALAKRVKSDRLHHPDVTARK